jgi:hypothetical protein
LNTCEELMLFQPWYTWHDTVSTLESRPVHQSSFLSICRMYLTLLQDEYITFTLPMCSHSAISGVELWPESVSSMESETWPKRWILRYPKCIGVCSMVSGSAWLHIVYHPASNSI